MTPFAAIAVEIKEPECYDLPTFGIRVIRFLLLLCSSGKQSRAYEAWFGMARTFRQENLEKN